MFTGIVAELGEVAGIEQRGDAARLTIRGSTDGVSPGDSIAVNGVCLTVTGILDGNLKGSPRTSWGRPWTGPVWAR